MRGKLETMTAEWDGVIIGGGAAGLSAALVLGRARRRTLVIDAGTPSNAAASAVGGFLGFDGLPPAAMYERGREQLAAYPSVEVRGGEVVGVGNEFTVDLADGATENTRTVLLATGMDYRAPDVPGLAELWGRSVFHCPFCHGWEMRGAPLAVLSNGDRAVHHALLLRGWTDDVVVLTDGPAELTAEQHGLLSAAGVRVEERKIIEFISRAGALAEVTFDDGDALSREGALVTVTLHQRSGLVDSLGVETVATPLSAASVVVDPFQRTSVPGVFAAGDVGAGMPQVAAAVASGSLAGAAIVQHLLGRDVGLPTPAWPTTKEDARV